MKMKKKRKSKAGKFLQRDEGQANKAAPLVLVLLFSSTDVGLAANVGWLPLKRQDPRCNRRQHGAKPSLTLTFCMLYSSSDDRKHYKWMQCRSSARRFLLKRLNWGVKKWPKIERWPACSNLCLGSGTTTSLAKLGFIYHFSSNAFYMVYISQNFILCWKHNRRATLSPISRVKCMADCNIRKGRSCGFPVNVFFACANLMHITQFLLPYCQALRMLPPLWT